jgi:hypothetical protein
MAPEAAMLLTPERSRAAVSNQSATAFSPTMLSDDDTISDNSFDAGSDHFAFTPRCPAKVPRAWERKPSTPFAPRTETQKIWKRVPLQDKNGNGATEIRANGNEQADIRGVKRARLTISDSDNGKENYANTQWDKQYDDAKRKLPKVHKTALQSTRNSLSPLRRDSTYEILNEPPPPTALELEADRVVRRLSQMQEEEFDQGKTDTASEGSPDTTELKKELMRTEDPSEKLQADSLKDNAPQTPSSLRGESDPLDEGRNIASEEGVASTPSGFFTDSIIFDDQESESEIDEPPIAQEANPDSDMSDRGSEDLPDEGTPDIEKIPDHSPLHSAAQIHSSETFQWHLRSSSEAVVHGDLQPGVDCMAAERAANTETQMPAREETDTSYEDATPVLNGYESVPDPMDTAEDLFEHSPADVVKGISLSNATVSESELIDAESETEESETSLGHNDVSLETVADPKNPIEANSEEAAVTDATALETLPFGVSNNDLGSQLFTPHAPPTLTPEAPPSDDTTYLHAFLTRARAQKAAREATSPQKMGVMASSPAKNTRQALANISTNPMSPSKSAQTDLKPDEPLEDELNDDQATSPCRRSSRPRLPKPQKSVVPAIPNTIPVRRSNGTEFVFLQRTEAMQIALATRNNTKRNKGEALPPFARLETIAAGEVSPTKEKKKKGSKTAKKVQWDKNLIREQVDAVLEEQAVIVEHEQETKPEPQMKSGEKSVAEAGESEKKERKKVKRLGTVNGTPAPKKVMAATALPVPTRTLRARTKT